ncbi:uncharacterized protein FTOL_05146 [Fusarium torulosum]|uniref:Uncharacterized protein n=1 Tax=Fusarium torulosum TaxID=33205 RepID=A0AAE8M787_9HYPO|nr:uncharacterized protein FTOL_05146 [Fusarium torulosum]
MTPSKSSSSKGKPANGESSRSTIRPTRIALWQQRALDRGRTPLPEAPGMRPWLKEQPTVETAPAVITPARAALRPLAPAPYTSVVTPISSQVSNSTASGSAEPPYQTPSSSPPAEKPQSKEEEEKDGK